MLSSMPKEPKPDDVAVHEETDSPTHAARTLRVPARGCCRHRVGHQPSSSLGPTKRGKGMKIMAIVDRHADITSGKADRLLSSNFVELVCIDQRIGAGGLHGARGRRRDQKVYSEKNSPRGMTGIADTGVGWGREGWRPFTRRQARDGGRARLLCLRYVSDAFAVSNLCPAGRQISARNPGTALHSVHCSASIPQPNNQVQDSTLGRSILHDKSCCLECASYCAGAQRAALSSARNP